MWTSFVPTAAARCVYYHHLFADLLRHELAAGDPGTATELHRRAYAWYRDAGLIVDAAAHATAANDVDAAIELVARHYAMFVGDGQLATVIRWINALPEAAAARDWLLCFAASVVMAHAGQIDAAEHWLALAKQAPAVMREGQAPASSLPALTAYLRLLRGDIGGGIANGRRALEAAPAGDVAAVLTAQLVLTSGLWWSPFTAEAKAQLESATRTAIAAGDPATTILLLGMRAAIALDEHPWAATSWVTHGILLGRRGDLDGAARAIERGVEFGERLRAWQLTVYASLALAEVFAHRGRRASVRTRPPMSRRSWRRHQRSQADDIRIRGRSVDAPLRLARRTRPERVTSSSRWLGRCTQGTVPLRRREVRAGVSSRSCRRSCRCCPACSRCCVTLRRLSWCRPRGRRSR
jgi:hypothetical protein